MHQMSITGHLSTEKIIYRISLKNYIQIKIKIVIIGAAVTSLEIIELLKSNNFFILADGSGAVFSTLSDSLAEVAWARSVCVVSDGDGGLGLTLAIQNEVPVILHAHGDNISSWSKVIDDSISYNTKLKLILTHQLPDKIEGMYNFGGFTDGDRAVCFIRSIGVPKERILIIGTRTDIVGQWSGVTNNKLKMSKLKWMEKDIKNNKYRLLKTKSQIILFRNFRFLSCLLHG